MNVFDDDVLPSAPFHLQQRLVKRLGKRWIEEHRTPILNVRRRLPITHDDDLLVLPRILASSRRASINPCCMFVPYTYSFTERCGQRRGLDLPRQIRKANDVQRVARIRRTNQ